MDDILKKYYYSDLCEVNTPFNYSDEAADAYDRKDDIYKELQKNLSEKDFALFENYIDNDKAVDSEDEYHAFCCGIRAAIRFVVEAFTSI